MRKVFEDYFSELHADMVSICLEYVNNKADKIYIYCSDEDKMISCSFFYDINGILVHRHRLNDALDPYDTTFRYDTAGYRQQAVLSILVEDVLKIEEVCKKYERDMPTEMKMVYNVKTGAFDAKYKYDLVYSNIPDKSPDDVANEWFNEVSDTQ